MEKYPYSKQAGKLKNLIESKGYSIYKFAVQCRYSTSRMYRIMSGEVDISTIQVGNIIIFARILGFKYVDDFLQAIDVDILDDFR